MREAQAVWVVICINSRTPAFRFPSVSRATPAGGNTQEQRAKTDSRSMSLTISTVTKKLTRRTPRGGLVMKEVCFFLMGNPFSSMLLLFVFLLLPIPARVGIIFLPPDEPSPEVPKT